MSSKRDLVEAHDYNRRRLITAFVSGAPGGREVEPVRYARALIGGVVLAGMVLAGAAVGGLIKPQLPDGWNDYGLVVNKDTGARYIALKDTLYPVINTTSGRLIASGEDGQVTINSVGGDQLDGMKIGSTIGIPGAPDALPPAGSLVQDGWVACTNEQGGLQVTVNDPGPATPVPDTALLVEAGLERGERYLISGTRRYPVSGRNIDNTLRTLGLPTNPFKAPGNWVNLPEAGPEIVPFEVPGQGERVETGVPGLDRAGVPVTQGGRYYILTSRGGEAALMAVSEFAYAVYTSGGPGAQFEPQSPAPGELRRIESIQPPSELASIFAEWPQARPEAYNESSPCLMLRDRGDFTETTLATPTSADAVPEGAATGVRVQEGRGAVVQESSANVRSEGGDVILIDSTGTRFSMDDDARARLGYGSVSVPAVSQGWTLLFEDGPALSRTQAARLAAADR